MEIREFIKFGEFLEELDQSLWMLFQLHMLELEAQDGFFYIVDRNCDNFVRISKKLYDYLKRENNDRYR